MKIKFLTWVLDRLVSFIRKRGFVVFVRFDVIGWYDYDHIPTLATCRYNVTGVSIEKSIS